MSYGYGSSSGDSDGAAVEIAIAGYTSGGV